MPLVAISTGSGSRHVQVCRLTMECVPVSRVVLLMAVTTVFCERQMRLDPLGRRELVRFVAVCTDSGFIIACLPGLAVSTGTFPDSKRRAVAA